MVRYFVAIVHEGSFTRAGGESGISQPALSQQIKRFEALIGVTLLKRTTSGPVLTVAGEAMLREGEHLLAAAERALRWTREVAMAVPAERIRAVLRPGHPARVGHRRGAHHRPPRRHRQPRTAPCRVGRPDGVPCLGRRRHRLRPASLAGRGAESPARGVRGPCRRVPGGPPAGRKRRRNARRPNRRADTRRGVQPGLLDRQSPPRRIGPHHRPAGRLDRRGNAAVLLRAGRW